MLNYIIWESKICPLTLCEVFEKGDLRSVEKEMIEKGYEIRRIEEGQNTFFLYLEKSFEFEDGE